MVSRRSTLGLNAVNFFLAEVVGVVIPFLSAFLKEHHWRYDEIGIATAIAGLGTFLFQALAGLISDRVINRRLLLALTSIALGVSYGILPLFADHAFGVDLLLFMSGAAGAFFVPLLASLALSLVGHRGFDRTIGTNQSWNHAGNITAALLSLLLVKLLGVESIFFVMASVSFIAAGSLLLIRRSELNPDLAREKSEEQPQAEGKGRGLSDGSKPHGFRELLGDPCVKILLVCVALFHIANAPVMPLVGLYLKHLGGGDDQVAWVVLIAQAVMVPIAWLAGKYCASRGRKPVFAVAFIALPLRIALYAITTQPKLILAFQALDGIGAGIYGVVIALICSDLTRGKRGFNSLMGLSQTALALGSVLGPLIQGFVTEHLGFPVAFLTFSGIATLGAVLFLTKMPETKNGNLTRRCATTAA